MKIKEEEQEEAGLQRTVNKYRGACSQNIKSIKQGNPMPQSGNYASKEIISTRTSVYNNQNKNYKELAIVYLFKCPSYYIQITVS